MTLTDRIYILDGAFGTMAQSLNLPAQAYALNGHNALGCNDVLCLTRPDAVLAIHSQYLQAGADIIETNSFNANAISLADYGLDDMAYEIAKASAMLGRQAIREAGKEGKAYVAGSMGPTNRSLSMSPNVEEPAYREIDYDQLRHAYREQAQGLIDGGADMLLIETAFDTLNAKAAIAAIRDISPEMPIMISATISDASGRTLSGQTIEAFCASVLHAQPLSIGLNCGYGARHLMPYLRRLSAMAPCLISVHPNAGLPNIAGGYDETPEMFADDMEEYFKEGIANIAGGCCGTTPEHIAAMSSRTAMHTARAIPTTETDTIIAGLEPLRITRESNFINIGERANVAGSAKFAKLIRAQAYDEALTITRDQVEAGAQVLDICMDDAMIDGPQAMAHFLNLIASEPEIARVPLMVDSSHWPTIEAGLKCCQGKCIVNSISLKEGEETFLAHARDIMKYGAAAVVMLFDEKGQADTYERKVEVAQRAYQLLTGIGFPPQDIIFDPNILAIATGIPAHDRFALDFIDATRWIKENLPHAKVSGGVSNLSFSFRGNNEVRKAMHSSFLYHAIAAGMDMAIVNPQMVVLYDDIQPELLERVEDALLCRRPDAAERLTEMAQDLLNLKDVKTAQPSAAKDEPQSVSVDDRIARALLKGDSSHIADDAVEALQSQGSPIAVINNLLMPAMERVGVLFAEGKMFLPQVVKSARAMKQAVDALQPYMAAAANDEINKKGIIVVATVKGDVHDIGKNIVSVVLACNGFEVIDLGVMVEPETIVAKAKETGADAIGLSGLITPSLTEMVRVVEEAYRQGLPTPIIIGGATTTPLHTAVKIATATTAPVFHSRDAADTARILQLLLSDKRDQTIAKNTEAQEQLRNKYYASSAPATAKTPHKSATHRHGHSCPCCNQPTLADLTEHINWDYFFSGWGLAGKYPAIFDHPERGDEARKLYADAQAMLREMIDGNRVQIRSAVTRYPASKSGDDIIVALPDGTTRTLPMLRSAQGECVADFVTDSVTLFALSAAFGVDQMRKQYQEAGDDYSAIMAKLLGDRLTEAYAECLLPGGCRIAIGYPTAPDHSLKRDIFDILDAEAKTGMTLTESYMIQPGESICGIWLDQGHFFEMGSLSEDAIAEYANRRHATIDEIKRFIPLL